MPAPSETQVREHLKTLSNRSRWGSEDELGTLHVVCRVAMTGSPVNPTAVS